MMVRNGQPDSERIVLFHTAETLLDGTQYGPLVGLVQTCLPTDEAFFQELCVLRLSISLAEVPLSLTQIDTSAT